jgi:RNA polymerase subunit RPABC4/transcription elongation factor Spt4
MKNETLKNQQCPNCDKQIAGFFKTCPFCKNTIAKPLTESALLDPQSVSGQEPGAEPALKPSSPLVDCSDCGHRVSKHAKACPGCGSAAFSQAATTIYGTTDCGACGGVVAVNAKQCLSCGTRLFRKPSDGIMFWLDLLYTGAKLVFAAYLLFALARCTFS